MMPEASGGGGGSKEGMEAQRRAEKDPSNGWRFSHCRRDITRQKTGVGTGTSERLQEMRNEKNRGSVSL